MAGSRHILADTGGRVTRTKQRYGNRQGKQRENNGKICAHRERSFRTKFVDLFYQRAQDSIAVIPPPPHTNYGTRRKAYCGFRRIAIVQGSDA
jgi:hypothetical protein